MKKIFIVVAIMFLSYANVFASQIGVTTSPLKNREIILDVPK